jgi:hypothetical protein
MLLKVGEWGWAVTLRFAIKCEFLFADGVVKRPSSHLGAVFIDKRDHFAKALTDGVFMAEARKRRPWQCVI